MVSGLAGATTESGSDIHDEQEEESKIRLENRELVQEAIQTLHPDLKLVIEASHFRVKGADKVTQEDLGKMLGGVSSKTIRNYKVRAEEEIKQYIINKGKTAE